MNYQLEYCIDSVESAIIAQQNGASRVELCSALFEGGLTPSFGMLRTVKQFATIPVSVMIRPRGGDFCYTSAEFEVMKTDLIMAKELGADQLVFGILLPNGQIDTDRCAELMQLAGDTPVTFHRAFDVSSQLEESLEAVIKLGCHTLLTSGQENGVPAGKETLKQLIELAGDRIIIMSGAGFTRRNFDKLTGFIGGKWYHITFSEEVASPMQFRRSDIYMGGALRTPEFSIKRTVRLS